MSVPLRRRREVRRRAGDACEYCRLSQFVDDVSHQVEHVRPRQHGGTDEADNLALACRTCNLHKGPNLAGVDPQTGQLTRLFDPRQDDWHVHFRFAGPTLVAKTPVGRTTVKVLGINSPRQAETRRILLAEGITFSGPV